MAQAKSSLKPNDKATGSHPKRIPQRTCVACRQTEAKRTLVRLVRTADQGVRIDPTGKRNGRGAYLCAYPDGATCWQRAVQSDVLEKALRTTLTEADRAHLQQYMNEHENSGKAAKPAGGPVEGKVVMGRVE